MRRFLERVFKDSSVEKNQPVSPSLPLDLAYSDLNFRTKRGFLAKKLGQYVGLNTDKGDALFYLSLGKLKFTNSTVDNELLLYLSEQMLNLSDQKQDITKYIKNLDVNNDIQNAMLKAYEIYKGALFSSGSNKAGEKETIGSTKKTSDGKWEVYRDVIFAATQEQFLLISEDELKKYKTGNVFCEGTIKERSDIPRCRNRAKEALEQQGYDKTKFMSWLLVLSEAITNTIKHAEEGKMTLIDDVENNGIRFVIEDNGPGFPLKDLPKTSLLAGYSTKKSMGQGFTLMLKMTKQVLLFTSSKGSTIILIFEANKKAVNLNTVG